MAQCLPAILIVLDHEGSEFCVDTGGPTKFGVTLASLIEAGDWDGDGYVDGDYNRDGRIDTVDIRMMTREDASAFYEMWWNKLNLGHIAWQDAANKIMDMTVNMGPAQATVLVQRASNSCSTNQITVDGKLGPQTLAALNNLPPRFILPRLRDQMKYFYTAIDRINPTKYHKYLAGWLNRAEC
jgi:lysozyme family protein